MNYNPETGIIETSVSGLGDDALGETLRALVFGHDKGYRDFEVPSLYAEIDASTLPEGVVDEMLGAPQEREDWQRVTAWRGNGVTVALASDGDTTLAFILETPKGPIVVINHDAKKSYGWVSLSC